MALEGRSDGLACGGIPEAQGVVRGAGDDAPSVGAEGDGEHRACMALEAIDLSPALASCQSLGEGVLANNCQLRESLALAIEAEGSDQSLHPCVLLVTVHQSRLLAQASDVSLGCGGFFLLFGVRRLLPSNHRLLPGDGGLLHRFLALFGFVLLGCHSRSAGGRFGREGVDGFFLGGNGSLLGLHRFAGFALGVVSLLFRFSPPGSRLLCALSFSRGALLCAGGTIISCHLLHQRKRADARQPHQAHA